MEDRFHSIEKDRQLISKSASGDKTAPEILVRRFSNLVYSSILSILRSRNIHYNEQDLEDLHNGVFLQLFENRCKKLMQYEGRNGCTLASWIRIITVRIALNHIRKKGHDSLVRQKRMFSLDEIPELYKDDSDIPALIENTEQLGMIRDGIGQLPPRDRLFIKLHFNHGLPISEVAETMQLSIDAAYTVKHRAIKRLKAYMVSGLK